MPPKKKSKTRQKKIEFTCVKCNGIFHTTQNGSVLHYSRNYTGPRMQLEIPKKATEETHQFERYHKAAESFGPGQESLNKVESRIKNRYSLVPKLEEKADYASHQSPPEMDGTVFNSNENNGFGYELESILCGHHGCPIVDVEEDNEDDPTHHMASLEVQYEDLYNDRFSAPPGLVIDENIEDINPDTTEFDKDE